MSDAAEFTVSLHHLAPDGTRCGAELPDAELTRLSAKKLRALLGAFAMQAPHVRYPAAPSLRIDGPHGQFLVQANAGQLRVTSWSTQANAENLTPDRILALIMGAEGELTAAVTDHSLLGRLPRNGKIVLLAVAIIGSNVLTAWFLTRPPARIPTSILPEYRSLDGGPAKRVLADFAGDYETGSNQGDRRLTIGADGVARWVQLGPNRAIADDVKLTLQAAEAHGHPVLVASNFGMIELKDPITLVYFGDTYRRRVQ